MRPARDIPGFNQTADGLLIDLPDTYAFGGWKLLAVFKALLDDDSWDFLYGTTTGSYVNTVALEEWVSGCRPHGLYAGTPYINVRDSWISGSSTLISRDVVELAVARHRSWRHDYANDRALGVLLAKHGVFPQTLPHRELKSVEEVEALTEEELNETVHFRCVVRPERTLDIVLMRALHARLYAEPAP